MDKSLNSPGARFANFTRRNVLATLALVAAPLAFSSTAALAQSGDFPNRAVTFVVPFPAGGNLDIFARAVALNLADVWKVPVLVDNRPGAGGMIGADKVAKAKDDGYTLLFTNTSVIQAPALYGSSPYDPFKDLAPVTQMGTVAIGLAIRGTSPVRTVQDYVKLVKSEPGKHSYSTYGVGSSAHLLMEGFKDSQGMDSQHVAYKGEGPSMTDLLGGQIGAGWFSERMIALHEKTGAVRPLAVTGQQRSSLLPNTPTFREAGFPGLEPVGWYGVFAPAGTPKAVVAKLSRDFNTSLTKPDIQAKLKDFVVRGTGTTPEAFAQLIVGEDKIWRGLIEKFGIKAE
ncbi:MAG: tripartite tricarboxylate transporter substrate binding protein [Comamonadaceae bacterium]|nr:MAG: tripartite tricarboxylate transporter substrate binding protein [Comamonadaceae bacterium]